jgi:hypothetical protein
MMHKTFLAFVFQLVLCAGLAAQQQYYSVKFPDDRTVIGCGAMPDTSDMPIIDAWGNCNFSVGVSVKDQVFNLNATGGCKKILRTWKLIWWCDYNPNWPAPNSVPNPADTDIGPTVIGDNINHGYLQYTQVIKVIDNVPPVFLNCPDAPVLFCDYTNNDPNQYGNRCEGPINLHVQVTDVCSKTDIGLTYRLYLDLDGNGSMETFRTSSAPDAWPIETTISGDTVTGKIKVPVGVGLPYGRHKVEWIASDGCGNQAICKYDFDVKDCKAPTIVCLNGLSVNIMPTGMITIWATDFIQYLSDNCTPNDLIKVGIRKAGTGSGFPDFVTSVTFDCNELGQQFVEVWAIDANGNADFCLTYINVQDHFGACVPNGPVSGNILTENQLALAGAKVQLKSNLPSIPQQVLGTTNAQGKFEFPAAPGTCNYSIIPQLDTLPLLGVNTLDLLLSDWHISGQQALTSPYKIIAADANRDGLVDATDLDALGNLILGTSNTFPNNAAWRFVPTGYTFPVPQAPLSNVFPEKISTTCPAPSGQNHHFVAIKTGDVDGSVVPTFTGNADDRAGEGEVATFYMPNQRYVTGEYVTATLYTPDLSTMLGFQFTLNIDPARLELVAVNSELNQRMATYTGQNRVTASWYTRPGEDAGERPVFTFVFKALQNSSLKQAIQFSSSITKAEAYNPGRQLMGVDIRFDKSAPSINFARLMPVSPNPTSETAIKAAFYLPESGAVTLSLSDMNGSAVSEQSGYYEAGWHQVDMSATGRTTGMYFLRLQSPFGSETQRVMIQRP